jgi:hypothetical protein
MANIKLRDLTSIAGADLFNDSESFIQDLSDDGLAIQGGLFFLISPITTGIATTLLP